MKFALSVCNSGNTSNVWVENYDYIDITNYEEAKAWAENTIREFNDSLKPGELPRTLVSVRIVGPSTIEVSSTTDVDWGLGRYSDDEEDVDG